MADLRRVFSDVGRVQAQLEAAVNLRLRSELGLSVVLFESMTAIGIILAAALLVSVQLRPRGSADDRDVHQPSGDAIPAPVLAECQLRNC
jgi:hypothetical protein